MGKAEVFSQIFKTVEESKQHDMIELPIFNLKLRGGLIN